MRQLIASTLLCVLASYSVAIAAEPTFTASAAAKVPETRITQRLVAGDAVREALQRASQIAPVQAGTQPSEPKPFVERHPVWFGTIAGAGVGAMWGVIECHGDCWPLNPIGAAMFGSWIGAPVGALIGWSVSRAK